MTTIALPGVVVTGGVDTHLELHVAAALDQLGRVLGTQSFPTTLAGYRQLLRWLLSFGQIDKVGVEGTGSYGSALARHLSSHDVHVMEVARPNRQVRRRYGKTDSSTPSPQPAPSSLVKPPASPRATTDQSRPCVPSKPYNAAPTKPGRRH
jgi:hypothetical protein